jgi:putative FmdB family regulatory protein
VLTVLFFLADQSPNTEPMPTYDYRCPDGHEFEKFLKMSDRARIRCPVCGKVASRKISGGAGLVFKGSGFYITDYGKDGKGPRKPTEEAAPKAEVKPDKAEAPAAKPEAKSEAKPRQAKKAAE